ncbi:MAG TPA: sulfite oxidase [Candidatus Angelobacter sp.]|jgi:DMSO/TMAO reductase YedYZ molybdopterin-dependent catalytic subunit
MTRSFSNGGEVDLPSPVLQAVPDKEKMIQHSSSCLELEMPVEFMESWITPVSHFFVRNHLDEPSISPGAWCLTVTGEVEQPIVLSLSDLAGIAPHSITSVLECAGNGRAFYQPQTPGTQWRRGAVGNAHFSGTRLRDILLRAGLKATAKHVMFRGLDKSSGQIPPFIRSIPIEKALEEDSLVATHMNHAPLTNHHGFPARAIVPGWIGASWCKWLAEIKVLDKEYEGEFMKEAYRVPRQPVPPGTSISSDNTRALTELSTKSVIAGPVHGATVKAGTVRIHGTAWTSDAEITRVDISTDGGATWNIADLEGDSAAHAWRLWSYIWKSAGPGDHVVMSRATDSRGRRQPQTASWNPSGYLYNAIDQIEIHVQTAAGGTR